MKRRIYYNLIVSTGLALSLVGCSKKLDLFPYDRIELSQSFKNMNDAKAYDNNLYGGLRGLQYGLYTISQDVQADQLNASLDYGNRNGNLHRWGSSFLADDYTIRDTWRGYYFTLKNVNAAIEGYPNVTAANAADQALLNRYKGNAHAIRAFIYHELMLRFSKAYNPATASTDLGVPLVLRYNPADQPARATAKQVYDQILSDLTQAATLLAGVNGAQGANRFTIHAVKALEARVKLWMQDWPGARTAAESVISSGTYPLYTTSAGLLSYWRDDATQETILQSFVSRPLELANTNAIYLGLVPANGKFVPDFIPSQWVVDSYDNADTRKNVYFERKLCVFQGADVPNVWLVNKYQGNPLLFTGATTNYQQAPKIFRVAELYLIAAEAAARMGSANESAALTHLNNLRTARGLTALSGISGTTLLNEIKAERFRELAFEGHRLWDLKRWNEGFTRRGEQNANIIQVGANFNTLNIAANDPKFTWAIPTNDMTTNPNLAGQQNPGW
ncbi:MAG: RagB/SusD family nutrient uptake outer membrane protein [Bacteroidetes bacterium]|uniref:RagB/SusD family nutrient uptake outer membrane protein n=1 Tax=Phnomibacter sp. TaxID=2836217 RepID=UPI002FDE4B00|nr:RagB/SusD family nutrient uptake outer membrane protein [Bacteroidota bacterium]